MKRHNKIQNLVFNCDACDASNQFPANVVAETSPVDVRFCWYIWRTLRK